MQEIIKELRRELNVSQEQIANMTGVSPVTVSRWENGKSKPSAMAQKQLYNLALNNNLDMSDFIVDCFKSNRDDILYHASRTGITGRIEPRSRAKCDFGKGFYMGTDPLQPLTLICNERKPVFYSMNIDIKGLKVLNIEVSLEWAMLIAYFRGYLDSVKGSALYEEYAHKCDGYDLIIGYIANDRMYQALTDFFEGRISDTALTGSLSALKLGRQYVAVSQEACDRIEILSARPLEKLELMFLLNRSLIRRKEGIALAREAVKKHRRDGRFFDEILSEDRI